MDMEAVHFFLDDVLANLTNLVGLKAEEKGLKLLFEVDDTVPTGLVGDPLRLGQPVGRSAPVSPTEVDPNPQRGRRQFTQ